jgi:hypothetical protein
MDVSYPFFYPFELLVGNQLLKSTVKETVGEDVAHRELNYTGLRETGLARAEGHCHYVTVRDDSRHSGKTRCIALSDKSIKASDSLIDNRESGLR